MSGRGEIVPEIADILRKIADRIDGGGADPTDAARLRKLALLACGEDKLFTLKMHGRRGAPSLGAVGVNRRLEMARAIKGHKDKHHCTNEAAYEAIDGRFNVGREALKKAWQQMSPILETDEDTRAVVLAFMRLEARGLAKVTHQKG